MAQRGQIIAEVIVAIGILGIILVGISDLVTKTTSSIRLNKQHDEAVRAVNSQLTYLRQERDADVNSFFTTEVNNTNCSWPITVSFTLTCGQSFSTDANGTTVTVTGTWTNKAANDNSVSLTEYLSR